MTAIEEYLKLRYHTEIVLSEAEDGDAGWVAEVKELTGCIAQGRTREELLENIDLAKTVWLEDALEAGDPIPKPFEEHSHSGKVLVRMPPYLHRELAAQAEYQGVSLNQLVVSLLAKRGADKRPGELDLLAAVSAIDDRNERATPAAVAREFGLNFLEVLPHLMQLKRRGQLDLKDDRPEKGGLDGAVWFLPTREGQEAIREQLAAIFAAERRA